MIQLIHFESGVEVDYNNSEKNPEWVFAFDSSNNFLQKFTYPCDIFSEEISSMLQKTKDTIIVEEDSFLYYSFWYQNSFSHYMCQNLPKLLYYNRTDRLVIPKSTYTILCKDILELLNIENDRLLILEDNIKYIFKNLKTTHHEYHGPGGLIHNDMYSICELLRKNLNITGNLTTRNVYLKRDGVVNIEFGNGEVGHYRKIVNETEIISYLETQGFEIIHLGDKTIREKCELLKDINILITPLGANCMNLIFSNCPKNILMLSNDRPIGPEYFINLCNALNNCSVNSRVITYPSINLNEDPKNSTNSPFRVDLSDIINYIETTK
jgi:capsular polysaccharide biosynthesis protein